MDTIIDVSTGEVALSADGEILHASAIASCIAVVMIDPGTNVTGLAHIMLPGESAHRKGHVRTRYAADAIDELIRRMSGSGARKRNIVACIAGGGNVLQRENDTICESNLRSVRELLEEKNIRIAAESVGGTARRRVMLDPAGRKVMCSTGDGPEELLFSY